MIQECQDRVFESYRSQYISTPRSESVSLRPVQRNDETLQLNALQKTNNRHKGTTEESQSDMITSICQPPPPQMAEQSSSISLPSSQQSEAQRSSDSGYESDTLLICKCTGSCTCTGSQSPFGSPTLPRNPGVSSLAENPTSVNPSGFSQPVDLEWPFLIPPEPEDYNWNTSFDVIEWPSND